MNNLKNNDVVTTLPANYEQIEIIKSLENNDILTIQSPNGFRKLETIVDVIKYFLNKDEEVLVTSNNQESLKSIREQLEKESLFESNLTKQELEFLHKTNTAITKEEENLLKMNLENLGLIWTTSELEFMRDDLHRYKRDISNWIPRLNFKEEVSKTMLIELLEESNKLKDKLNAMTNYEKQIINKSLKNSNFSGSFKLIKNDYEKLMNSFKTYKKIIDEDDYKIPKKYYGIETLEVLNEIIESKKEVPINSLSKIIKPKWRQIQEGITKDSKKLEHRRDFINTKFIILYELNRKNLLNKLKDIDNQQIYDIENQKDIEENIKNTLAMIETLINWYKDIWISFVENIKKYTRDKSNFEETNFTNIDNPLTYIENLIEEKYIKDIIKTKDKIAIQNIYREIEEQREFLNQYKDSGSIIRKLLNALETLNIDEYESCYDKLIRASSKKDAYFRRLELIGKLREKSPVLAKQIERREIPTWFINIDEITKINFNENKFDLVIVDNADSLDKEELNVLKPTRKVLLISDDIANMKDYSEKSEELDEYGLCKPMFDFRKSKEKTQKDFASKI